MGLMNRFFGRPYSSEQTDESSGSELDALGSHAPRQEPARSSGADIRLVTLSGTTTICKDAIASLVTRHSQEDDGYLVIKGSTQREPNNPVDPNAVAVYVEGDRIAYLPGYIANALALSNNGSESGVA
jgi:hypothetical protein